MSNNRISAGISITMPDSIQSAISIIASLTGESPRNLSKLSVEELNLRLSKLLENEKEKVQQLLENHDQNQKLDPVSLAYLWKLVEKKVVPAQKQKFGSIKNKTFEEIQFHQYQKTKESIYRASNNLGAASSSYTSSIPKKVDRTNISPQALSPILHRMKHALEVSNKREMALAVGGRK